MKRRGEQSGAEPRKHPALEQVSTLLAEGDSLADFDSRQLHISLQALEKAICLNQESRLRYSDEPLKFQQSEEELYNAILRFKAVPEEAEMQVVQSAGLENLVGLLGHENLDLGNCALEVLLDWCEGDTPIATAMLERLCSLELLSALITLLTRLHLSSDRDSEVLYNALSLLECVFTAKPELLSGQPAAQLAKWTLEQLATAEDTFSTNKLYLVETLASILSQPSNYQTLTELKGVEIVLKSILSHSNREPEGKDEKEFLANLFDCLSSLLLHPTALEVFRRLEGLSALTQLLRLPKLHDLTLKALDVTLRLDREFVAEFIKAQGLKLFFPLFLRSARKQEEEQRCVLSVLFSLYRYAEAESVERVHWKLIENGYEKLKLVKFYWDLYLERVEEDMEGLTLLSIQHLSFIIASLCRCSRQGVQSQISAIIDLNQVKATLQHWSSSLGEEAVSGSDLRSILPGLIQNLP